MRRTAALLLLVSALCFLASAHTASHEPHSGSSTGQSDLLSPRIAPTGHRCIHDEMEALKFPVKRVEQTWDAVSATDRSVSKRDPNWMPFRVTIVSDNLVNDPRTCYSAGQSVPTDGGPNYSCTADDIMTPTKLAYLNNSMLGVAVSRLAELFKVDRAGPITVSPSSCSKYV